MLNKLLTVIVISILVVFFPAYAKQLMSLIMTSHAFIVDLLANIFSDGTTGRIIRDLLALLILPLGIGLIPAIIYWVVKRRFFPYFMFVVW